MATPVVELIAANLETVIKSVIKDIEVEGNAYNYTLSAIRPTPIDFRHNVWADRLVLINQGANTRGKSECMRVTRTQFFELCAIVKQSIDTTESIDIKQNEVAADITKALMVDETRGGNAEHTEVGDAYPFEKDESPLGVTGINIIVAVTYKTLEKDPYTQG